MAEKESYKLIRELRAKTGMGMMDCKKALEASGGDIEKAIDFLRKKGVSVAAKRSGKQTSQGIVHSYIHSGNRIGVLVEINCETDFVARTDAIKNFAHDLCLHIVATNPLYLLPEDIDEKLLEHEKMITKEQFKDTGKPEKIISQIIDGKINAWVNSICLIKQSFVKNDQKTIDDLLKEVIARTGENIKIRRFVRFEIGA